MYVKIETIKKEFTSDNQNLPLTLNGFLLHNLQEGITRPNGIPLYQWIQGVDGIGELILDDQKYTINVGQGIFLMANTPHSCCSITDRWITHTILFAGSACEQILNGFRFKQSGVYQVNHLDLINNYIGSLIKNHQEKPPIPERLYSKELYAFLLDLSYDIQRIHRSEQAFENKIVRIVDQYLFDHFDQPIALDTLAELVDIRKEYLCKLFKRHMQQTISLHLQMIRIAHAKFYLIDHPERTVKEIGVMCGFDSSSYFCKIFKKKTGYSPDEYRRIH